MAEILARIGAVMAAGVPFDPLTSNRRFVIAAPDAVMAAAMTPLLETLGVKAPGVNIGLIHVMPLRRGGAVEQPWQESLTMLERRELDIAMLPVHAVAPRFEGRRLYDEDFVVAMREGHAFARAPTQAAFCRSKHLLVSMSGDPHGFIDELLAKRGFKRRVVLTVPTFMMALAQLSRSDLLAALPRRLVELYALRFGLTFVELPFRRKRDPIQAVATKAAMKDAGVAWLMEAIVSSVTKGHSSDEQA